MTDQVICLNYIIDTASAEHKTALCVVLHICFMATRTDPRPWRPSVINLFIVIVYISPVQVGNVIILPASVSVTATI